MYVENNIQADWKDIAERLVHAMNNSRDSTRNETPFYLVHGWNTHLTLKSMIEPIRRLPAAVSKVISSADPVMWRRESKRQREVALKLAKDYQVSAKARRSKDHNEGLIPSEQQTIPRTERLDHTEKIGQQDEGRDVSFKTRFDEGDQVWLFIKKVRPGLKKKVAHRWHGNFGIKR